MMHGGKAGSEYLIQFSVSTTDGSLYCNPNFDAVRVRVI